MLCLGSSIIAWAPIAYAGETFDIRIPEQSVGEAVKNLSYQTRHSVLFKHDVLGDAKTKPIAGRYSLDEALKRMLIDTNLKGSLTESGVVVISLRKGTHVPSLEGTTVAKTDFKQTLLTGAAALSIAGGVQSTAQAQTVPEPQEVIAPTISSPEYTDDEIIVTGRRLNQNLAIATKRDAKQIIDTITADQSSRLPDNSIAESLGRIPGVTFLRSVDTGDGQFISIRGLDSALNNIQFDGVNAGVASDGARRVGIDGITSDDIAELRVVKSLLPEDEGEGIGGAVKIISRTALERGEDRLKLGLQGRLNDFHNKLGFETSAAATKIFSDNFGVNVSGSFRRREIRNFEIDSSSTNLSRLPTFSVGGQSFTNQDVFNAAVADDNEDIFDAGTAFDNVPAGTFSPDDITFEDQTYGTQRQTRDTFTFSGSMDWQASPNTLFTLGGRITHEDITAEENFIRIEDDDGDFVNADGSDIELDEPFMGPYVTDFRDPEIDVSFEIEDQKNIQTSLYLRGKTELDRLKLNYQASYSGAENKTPETKFDFDTASLLSRNSVNPVPFSYVDRYFPVPSLGVLDDQEFVDAVADLGAFEEINSIDVDLVDERKNDRYALRLDGEYDLGWQAGGGTFNAIKVGAKYERSDLKSELISIDEGPEFINLDGSFSNEEGTGEDSFLNDVPGLFSGDVQGLSPIGSPLDSIGIRGIPIPNDAAFRSFADNFGRTLRASPDFNDVVDREFRDVSEDVYAGYFQTEFEAGNLTVTGGVRVEHYEAEYRNPVDVDGEVDITNLVNGAEAFDSFDLFDNSVGDAFTQTAENTEVLPRMNAIFKVSDTFQIRGGAGLSIARPTISQLSSPVETELNIEIDREQSGGAPLLVGVNSAGEAVAAGGFALGDITDGSLDITSGNPNLKNAVSRNFDLSAEWYPKSGTSFAIGLFHKRIKNFIFIGAEPASGGADVSSLDATLTTDARTLLEPLGGIQGLLDSGVLDLDITQPQNGDVGIIKGIEIGVNHQLDWASGIFADMGFNANITFTDSKATIPVSAGLEDDEALVLLGVANEGDSLNRRTQFFNSPPISGNASIYYEANGFDVAVSGSYQDQSFNAVDDFGLDQYDDEYWKFDFYASYNLPSKKFGDATIYFEVPDFTDGGRKPTSVQTIGKTRQLFDLATFNGREYRFGIRTKF